VSVIKYTDRSFVKKLESKDKMQAIEELASTFEGTPVCTDIQVLIKALKEREEIMSTGIGFGIAIPHAKIAEVKKLRFAIGVSKEGINFDSMDGKPVHLIILVAAGETQHKDYLGLLSNIMALLKNEDFKEKIINAESVDEIITLLKEQLN
jgi:fructose PTS system EIIBC or EIIC component